MSQLPQYPGMLGKGRKHISTRVFQFLAQHQNQLSPKPRGGGCQGDVVCWVWLPNSYILHDWMSLE